MSLVAPVSRWRRLRQLFDLREDQQDAEAIDRALRAGAQLVGTNLWVLFFAILIASVGLNVNATAVIIGAMLISPLMGPIVGAGYGAAVNDLALIRLALKNLAIFSLLSLATSTLYFSLSPLDQPGSELLARTTPNLWDVLIALFGGAAGMVAVTRRSFSNIVPGVAIATALMPPLCTVGFGLAHARWDMAVGAVYLFLINSVCIAASALAVSKLLRLPVRGALEAAVRLRHRVVIVLGLVAVMGPSVWLGYRFVQHELFDQRARQIAHGLEAEAGVIAHDIDADRRTLRLTVLAGRDAAAVQARAQAQLQGFSGTQVEVLTVGDTPLDAARLRRELAEDLNRTLLQQLQLNEQRVKALEARLDALPPPAAPPAIDTAAVAEELRMQLPQARSVSVTLGAQSGGPVAQTTAVVLLDLPRALAVAERERVLRWLKLRLARDDVQLIDRVPSPNRARPT